MEGTASEGTASWKRLLGIGVALVACGLIVALILRPDPHATGDTPGAASAEEFVRDYVEALNTGDATTLAAVLGHAAESTEVRALLARCGDRDLTVTSLQTEADPPGRYLVSISATSDGEPMRMLEVLEWSQTAGGSSPADR
jgi:hypothetical protein